MMSGSPQPIFATSMYGAMYDSSEAWSGTRRSRTWVIPVERGRVTFGTSAGKKLPLGPRDARVATISPLPTQEQLRTHAYDHKRASPAPGANSGAPGHSVRSTSPRASTFATSGRMISLGSASPRESASRIRVWLVSRRCSGPWEHVRAEAIQPHSRQKYDSAYFSGTTSIGYSSKIRWQANGS